MSLSLYEAIVPGCQQILGGMSGLIDKAQAHVAEHGLADSDLIEARLGGAFVVAPCKTESEAVSDTPREGVHKQTKT